jgi:hypothetical protein
METSYQYYIELFILCYLIYDISNSFIKDGNKKKTSLIHNFCWTLSRNVFIIILLYFGGMSFDIF